MQQTLRLEATEPEWLYVPDVTYAEYGDCSRKLHLFVPYRPAWTEDTRYPLVSFLPGSGWGRQEMYNSVPAYAKLAERGFVVAVVQYREAALAQYPAQVEDLNRAVAFVRSKQEEAPWAGFHMDTEHIFLAGNSSGGHIALMAALRRASGIVDGPELPGFPISGVISVSAPSDILLCAQAELPSWIPEERRPCKVLLGLSDLAEDPARVASASSADYIRPDVPLPPILLFHGAADGQVSVTQSRQLYRQLSTAGKAADYYELEQAGHGGAVFWSRDVLDIMEAFLRRACTI
ncbi:MAG: alpha/beta hydrolase [Clostridiales bacterium]|nr:alpha/beta hydrolase [Clostridiales bacterium]